MNRNYEVVYNGEVAYHLNSNLAVNQRVTDEQLEALKRLHQKKLSLFALARLATKKIELRKIAADFEATEFEMQKNWNFPQDCKFHEWYTVPKCICPKMDNMERRGATDSRIIVETCPVHGKRRRGE
jgi:hypothetical protein